MKIALINFSSDPMISPSLLARIAGAVEHQTTAHYAAVWQADGATMLVYPSLEAVPNDGDTSPLAIYDDPDQSGDLGWHSTTDTGRPFGRVFWGPVKDAGGSLLEGGLSLAAVVSHETLEMLGDPYINWWCDAPDGKLESLEIADRTQGDHYEIGGVTVSNFLGPRAFSFGPGPYDYMGLLRTAFEVRPGGYAIRRDPATGVVDFVWGDAVPEWKKALVSHHGRRIAALRGRTS